MTRPLGATALVLPVVLGGGAAIVPPQATLWAERANLQRAETISVHSAPDQDRTASLHAYLPELS
jgi:hypothetical protein